MSFVRLISILIEAHFSPQRQFQETLVNHRLRFPHACHHPVSQPNPKKVYIHRFFQSSKIVRLSLQGTPLHEAHMHWLWRQSSSAVHSWVFTKTTRSHILLLKLPRMPWLLAMIILLIEDDNNGKKSFIYILKKYTLLIHG